MNRYLELGFVFLMVFFVLSCTKKGETTVLVPDDYRNWSMTADKLNYPVPGHGSNLRKIYINKIGENVSISKVDGLTSHEYPNGTIVIKEMYSSPDPLENEDPEILVAMIKDSSHPDSVGGWVWAKKDVLSGEVTLFDYEFCVSCHANANESHQYGDGNINGDFQDYLFFPFNK